MPTAYAYSRFSSPAQARGDSARRQLEAATSYAKAHDLTLDTTLRDEGVSGFTGANRVKGALGSFLRRVEEGQIERGSYLLIDSIDRLSRESETQVAHLLSSIALSGVRVVNMSEDHVLDERADFVDWMRVLIHAARANRESAEKGRKVRAAHAAGRLRARESGAIYTPVAPQWLRRVGDRWELVQERVAVVRRIFGMKEQGLGHGYIAAALNAEGILTARGKTWTGAGVRDLLRSRTVLGEYQPSVWNGASKKSTPDGDAIANYYPQIVDDDQFYRVQALVDGRRNPNAAARTKDFRNLLVGLVTCEVCGGAVGYLRSTFPRKPQWNARGVLRCNNVAKGTCTNRSRVPYENLEAALLAFVATLPVASGRPSDPAAAELAVREAERAEAQRRIDTLLDQVEGGSVAVLNRLRQREAELVTLETEIARLRADQKVGASAPAPAEAKAEIERLRKQMEGASGDQLYALRARLNAALRKVSKRITLTRDTHIEFSVEPGAVLRSSKAEAKQMAGAMLDRAEHGRLRWHVTNVPDGGIGKAPSKA